MASNWLSIYCLSRQDQEMVISVGTVAVGNLGGEPCLFYFFNQFAPFKKIIMLDNHLEHLLVGATDSQHIIFKSMSMQDLYLKKKKL